MYEAFSKTQSPVLTHCEHQLQRHLSFTLQKLQVQTYSSTLCWSWADKSPQDFWKKGPPWLQQSQRNLICPTYYSLQYRNYLPLSNVKSNKQPWTCLSDNIRTNIKIPNVGWVQPTSQELSFLPKKAVVSLIKQWGRGMGGREGNIGKCRHMFVHYNMFPHVCDIARVWYSSLSQTAQQCAVRGENKNEHCSVLGKLTHYLNQNWKIKLLSLGRGGQEQGGEDK